MAYLQMSYCKLYERIVSDDLHRERTYPPKPCLVPTMLNIYTDVLISLIVRQSVAKMQSSILYSLFHTGSILLS